MESIIAAPAPPESPAKFFFRLSAYARQTRGERLAYRFSILRIEAPRDLADLAAERLALAQKADGHCTDLGAASLT